MSNRCRSRGGASAASGIDLAAIIVATGCRVTPSAGSPPAIDMDPPSYRERPTDRPATPRQVQAIERLTLKLGANAGDWLYERIGETPPHCLSLAEASALIDELQTQFPPPSRLAG